jgi:uncharacterized protein
MSELIQNDAERQGQLKKIIHDIHKGKDISQIKKRFAVLLRNVSPDEIAAMENALLQEGLPAEQIQELCEVHVSVFESSLKRNRNPKKMPGHPVHSYLEENKVANKLAKGVGKTAKKLTSDQPQLFEDLKSGLDELEKINIHYQRKENQLFPLLEAANFEAPSKVMWGKHDEARELLKNLKESILTQNAQDTKKYAGVLVNKIRSMIFMEEKILFPTALRKLTDDAWVKIKEGEPEIGYAWIKPGNVWDVNIARDKARQASDGSTDVPAPAPVSPDAESSGTGEESQFHIDEGSMTIEQINLMLKALPLDVTFVDENDTVRYYSSGAERIFPRSPAIIGRAVQNCHPPKSVHIVEKIIDSFKKKEKDTADFWMTMNDKFIHIRYFAVYDSAGEYKGVVEMSQDVTGIRALEGERKLLDW